MGSLEELHSGRDRSYIVAGWAIIIGTLKEGYFQPPILLHSLPMDTRAIIRLSCGIFLDGFAGQTSSHRNGSDPEWDTIPVPGVQHSQVADISLLDAMLFSIFYLSVLHVHPTLCRHFNCFR